MFEVKYKKILQTLFYLTLFSPLIVDRRLFFPYVTGMALYFRFLVEALFALWLVFILFYPKYRPKLLNSFASCLTADSGDKKIKWQFNYLITAVFVYLFALGAATYFSANPYLSFWGDAERMMGLFGILHYFALYFVGASIFRDKKDPRKMLAVFVFASLLICAHGILQRFGFTSIKPGAGRILATVGNAGILASYLIFGLFFSAHLSLTEKKKDWRNFFIASALIHLIAVIMTGTRGAYLGVAAGILFGGAVIFRVLFQQNHSTEDPAAAAGTSKLRKDVSNSISSSGRPIPRRTLPRLRSGIVAAVVAVVLLYGGLFISRDQDWVKNNLYLNRLTAFSLNDVTVKTRLMSWRWGLSGFRDKPVIGYGLEQYAIPYNKYFQAEYYNYAAGDTYFDRAHNIVVELLATTGITGLMAYLLLLSIVLYSMLKSSGNKILLPRQSAGLFKSLLKQGRSENNYSPIPAADDNKKEIKNDYFYLAAFGGLLIAYFIQNLFIFDMLPAMIGFTILLISANFNYVRLENQAAGSEASALRKTLAVPVALILFAGFFYSCGNYIIKPYKALIDNVAGQVYLPHDYNKGMEALKKSVSYHTPLDLDLRSAAANTIFNYYRDNQVDAKNIKSDIDFAIGLYKENLNYLPDDVYFNYKIAEITDFRFAADLDVKIIKEARPYIEKAISLSPGRAELYYIKAENLLMDGKMDEAVAADQKAVSLNDKFGQSYWELAKVCFEAARYPEAKENLVKAIDLGYRIQEETLISLKSLFNLEQSAANEMEFLELIVKNGTGNYLIYSTLANRYYEAGNKEKAIYYAEKSAEINPEFREKVEKFIEIINSK